MILYRFVPPNKEKFDSARFVYVREANNIGMMYADDFGITILAAVPIIVAVLQ
jgi:hypothetical protein